MIRSLPRVWSAQISWLHPVNTTPEDESYSVSAQLRLADLPLRTTLRLFWKKAAIDGVTLSLPPTTRDAKWSLYPVQVDDSGRHRLAPVFQNRLVFQTLPHADAYELASGHRDFDIELYGTVVEDVINSSTWPESPTEPASSLRLAVECQPDDFVSVEEWEAAFGAFQLSAPPSVPIRVSSGAG